MDLLETLGVDRTAVWPVNRDYCSWTGVTCLNENEGYTEETSSSSCAAGNVVKIELPCTNNTLSKAFVDIEKLAQDLSNFNCLTSLDISRCSILNGDMNKALALLPQLSSFRAAETPYLYGLPTENLQSLCFQSPESAECTGCE